jgi:lysophospholipase L1-like esterase
MAHPTSGLIVHLDPDQSTLYSDQAGTVPVTAEGSLVRKIAGVGGLGSASGNPADAHAARLDTLTYPGGKCLWIGGPEVPFTAVGGLGSGATRQSFTLAFDYVPLTPAWDQCPTTIAGDVGVYASGNRLFGYSSRYSFAGLTTLAYGVGRHRIIIRGDAASMRFRIDGSDYADAAGDTNPILSGSIGASQDGTLRSQIALREYLVWNRALSDAEVDDVDAVFTGRTVAPLPAGRAAVVCDGNSLMLAFGAGSAASPWPWLLEGELGRDAARVLNLGAHSAATPNLIAAAAADVDAWADGGRVAAVLVLQEGTMHVASGVSGATAYGSMNAWRSARASAWPAGTKFVVCTIPPADWTAAGYSGTAAAKETARADCNALIRSGAAADGWDAVIDWEDAPELDDAADTAYYQADGLHWTAAGQPVAAALAASVIAPLLGVGGPALAAGSISITTPATETTVGLTVTEATGGTGPYTRQWHRSTSSGFAPDGSNDLPGETALTLSDTGLTASTTYYYKVVQADDAAASVTTAQQAVTTDDPAPTVLYKVACEGDSQTEGYGLGAGDTYPERLREILGDAYEVVNLGTSGDRVEELEEDAAATDAEIDAGLDANVLVVFAGTNNVAIGNTAAETWTALESYLAGREAAGWAVVVVTMLPRLTEATLPTYEARRQEVNASIRSNWRATCAALADLAIDARMSDAEDTAYFNADKVHLNAAGAGILANYAAAAVAMAIHPGGSAGVGSLPLLGGGLVR